jgi:hypothetical protein
MGLLDVLAFPITAPIDFVTWLAEKIAEQVDSQYYSEEALRSQLVDLELKLDMGEISEEEYTEAEDMILGLMKQVRALKKARLEMAAEAEGDIGAVD